MGPDELNLSECYLTDSEGNRFKINAVDFSGFPKIGIDFIETPVKTIPRFSGSLKLKLSERNKRRMNVLTKTTLENARLIPIYNRVNKRKTKKKLLGRISRNIYEQVKCGL